MVRSSDFEKLKESVEALRSELNSKLLDSSVKVPLEKAIASLDDKIGLNNRIIEIQQSVQFWKVLFTVLLTLSPILGVLAGVLGLRSYADFRKRVEHLVEVRVQDVQDLGYGLAMVDQYPALAIPHLKKSVANDLSNEAAVSSVLIASDNVGDWSTGHEILLLLSNDTKHNVTRYKSPWTYNALGLAALNSILSDSKDLPTAKQFFERGLSLVDRDPEAAWYLHTNFWRYYLAMDDKKGATCEAALASTFPTPAKAPTWDDSKSSDRAKGWEWFDVYFSKHPLIDEAQVASMFAQFAGQSKRRLPDAVRTAKIAVAVAACGAGS